MTARSLSSALVLVIFCCPSHSSSENRRSGQQQLLGIVSPYNNSSSHMRVIPAKLTFYSFEYQKGFRLVGDELLVSDKKSYTFPSQDVAVEIRYPGAGQGSLRNPVTGNAPAQKSHIITHYMIWVSQDSQLSRGFQMKGGIFCDYIHLKIEASDAKSMSVELRIYGIDNIILPSVGYGNYECTEQDQTPLDGAAKPGLGTL